MHTDTGRLKHDSAGFAGGSGFGGIFENFSGGGSGVFRVGKSRLGVGLSECKHCGYSEVLLRLRCHDCMLMNLELN